MNGSYFFFFFNDTATTEIYTLSLHDTLPILITCQSFHYDPSAPRDDQRNALTRWRQWYLAKKELPRAGQGVPLIVPRSEEHTSELQSQSNLVCRLLLEKKKSI